MTEFQKHYICLGECKGVSEKPGKCNDKKCSMHMKELVECNCSNEEHLIEE